MSDLGVDEVAAARLQIEDVVRDKGLTVAEAVLYLSCGRVLPVDIFQSHVSFHKMRTDERIDIEKIRTATLGGGISKVYQCRKCFSNNISVRNMQMRAGDEGQTEIRTCQQCGTVTHVNS
jgi:DNA-directed RNA polymerase subunit M/transcription elongation factor TFIIS